jgi:hypothetical protein
MIDASCFPAAHELDPVERRSAVPALDENRAAEAGGVERWLSAQLAAVRGIAVSGPWLSPKMFHLTPSDARHDKRFVNSFGIDSIPVLERYTERSLRASADFPAHSDSTANDFRGAKLSEMIEVTPVPGLTARITAKPGIGAGIPR